MISTQMLDFKTSLVRKYFTAKLPETIVLKSSMKMGSLESFDGKFATFFFLKGDEINGRGWGVTSESIPLNIHSGKGMPYVITAEEFIKNSPYKSMFDHPSLEHLIALGIAKYGEVNINDLDKTIEFQDKFRIGEMKEFFQDKDSGAWRVIVEIDEPFRDMNLPPFVSPAVWKLKDDESDTAMTVWRVLHLAGLKERPAYGAQAIKKAECRGTLGTCESQLKVAKGPYNVISQIIIQRFKLASLVSQDLSNVEIKCQNMDKIGKCQEKSI